MNNHGKFVGMAHRIIWEVANGPIPDDKRVEHWNGNRSDDRITNLRLVTCSEILADQYASCARNANGSGNPRARLSEDDVFSIRCRYGSGLKTQADLAREYGVSPKTINHVCTGYRWCKP